MSDLDKLSTDQLLAKHNELAKSKGKPSLASWKQSKQGLIARIELLQDNSKPKTVAPAPEPKIEAPSPATESQPAAAPEEQQPKAAAKKAAAKPATKEDDMSAKKATAKKAAKKTTAKKAAKPAANGTRGQIGAFIAERIDAGDDNKTILEKVQKKFPDARTSYGSIASTRSRHGK